MTLRVTVHGDRLAVTGDTLTHRFVLSAVLGARWESVARAWTYPATPHGAWSLLDSLERLGLVVAPEVAELAQRASATAPAREDALGIPVRTFAPWRHQTRAAWWLADREAALLQYGMGCLAGDSEIHVSRGGKGYRMTISALVERELRGWPKPMPTMVRGLRVDGSMGMVRLVGVQATGWREVVEMRMDDGRSLTLTAGHEVVTPEGKIPAERLAIGDAVMVDAVGGRGFDSRARKVRTRGAVSHLGDGRRIDRANLAGSTPRVAHVASIRPLSVAVPVYDLSVDDEAHTYVANGIVVGNTGKTRAALDALRIVGARRTLVVCPLAVVPSWAQQAALHHGEYFRLAQLDRGSLSQRQRALAEAMRLADGRPLIAAVNYEAVWRALLAPTLAAAPWDVVIYDEGHRLKSPSSAVSGWAARFRRQTARRWALSGTPLAHSPMDAYGLFRALDPGLFGTSFAAFRARYAYMGGFQQRQVVSYRNMDDFRARYYRVTLAQGREVLDLPEFHHVERPVRLPAEALLIHRRLKEEFVATLADGREVSAPNALTRLLRLQQLSSGFVQEGDDDTPTRVHTAKLDSLAELLVDLDAAAPVVVFARFRHDLADVHAAARSAGRASYELSGSRRELSEWQARKDGSVLVAQIQSGSEGIDLTRAAHCVYYSVGFSLAQFEQSQARVHRPGQTRTTYYHHLIAEGTIDRYVYRTLRSRRDVIDAVLARRGEDLEEES